MSENMKKLMEILTVDESAADKVFECETMKSAFAAAVAISGGYTFEEFNDAMEMLKNAARKVADEELLDKDLDDVAGGGFYNPINERLLAERYSRGQLGERKTISF